MGNKVSQKSSYNIIDTVDLKEFLSCINDLEGSYVDTNLSISSKCLVIINNLINYLSISNNVGDDLTNYQSVDIFPGVSIQFDEESLEKIEKFKLNCQLIRHLSIFNSNSNSFDELIELNNFSNLNSLHLENLPINHVQHLKLHRETLIKVSVHSCISDLESLLELCGGDHSFSGHWNNLVHLDLRFNKLRSIDNSVSLLSSIRVLDISRNDIRDIGFIDKIASLVCLNASYNCIKSLPKIQNHCLQVLIIGYNYLTDLKEINNFKLLSTLNVSFNLIATSASLHQLNELDFLKDLVLRGNPICTSHDFRLTVLSAVSPRVMINFALDGRIFTKKEKILLNKISVIVIEPPSTPIDTLYSKVPTLRPKHRAIDIKNLSGNSPQMSSSGFTRPVAQIADIDNQTIPTLGFDNDIVEADYGKFLEPKLMKKEKQIVSISGTEYDSTIQGSQPDSSNKLLPFYFGEKTSNLISTSHKSRESFFKVSLQIMENKFMAVDADCLTVNNVNLWTLLYATQDSESNNILRLVFFDENNSDDMKTIYVLNQSLEFADVSQSDIFLEQLGPYLNGFSVCYEDNTDIINTNLTMTCTRCRCNFRFKPPTYRPVVCTNCQNIDFIFEKSATKTEGIAEISRHLNPPVHAQNNMLSPRKKQRSRKQRTSEILIKAFSTECLCKESDTGSVLSGVSDSTSYQTAINDFNDHDGKISQLETTCDSTEISYCDANNSDAMEETLNLNFAINSQNMSKILDFSTMVIPNMPEDDPVLLHINSFIRSDWVVFQPLSNVHIYNDNMTKIDDRIKLHFLTKIMGNDENMHAAFKTYMVYKVSTSNCMEVLVILTNKRMMFYNWVDKNSPSLEDCLKFVMEFKFKILTQIDDCLNHQWLQISFKGKSPLVLLIGDSRATKNTMQTITEIATEHVAKLNIRTLKEIDKLKCNTIVKEMLSSMHEKSTVEALNSCEYYLVKTCSCMPNESSSSEYVPKMIGIQTKHLFFINIKFVNKPFQMKFELHQTSSLFSINNKILVDKDNNQRCCLNLFENGFTDSIDIEFMSPAARSQALFYIGKLWKELFQTTIEFELKSFNDDKDRLIF